MEIKIQNIGTEKAKAAYEAAYAHRYADGECAAITTVAHYAAKAADNSAYAYDIKIASAFLRERIEIVD